MIDAVQAPSRIRAFAFPSAFSFQEQKPESLDDLLSRTSRQVELEERSNPYIGAKGPRYPFANATEIIDWLADYSVIIEGAGELRAAILKLLNKSDCRDFKKFMKMALHINRPNADDLKTAEDLIDAYKLNEDDIMLLYKQLKRIEEIQQMQECASNKGLA